MKKAVFFVFFLSVCAFLCAQDINMPQQDLSGVNSIYSLLAVLISSVLPFIILLLKLIFDNKKNSELSEYIKKHDEQHKEDRKDFRDAINANVKKIEKTEELLQRLVDNDIKQDKRILELEVKIKER